MPSASPVIFLVRPIGFNGSKILFFSPLVIRYREGMMGARGAPRPTVEVIWPNKKVDHSGGVCPGTAAMMIYTAVCLT